MKLVFQCIVLLFLGGLTVLFYRLNSKIIILNEKVEEIRMKNNIWSPNGKHLPIIPPNYKPPIKKMPFTDEIKYEQ